MSDELAIRQSTDIQRNHAQQNQMLIARYVDWLRVRNLSPSTIRQYGRPLFEFAALLGSTSFRDVTHTDILDFLGKLHASGITNASMFVYCSSLRSFGKFLSALDIPNSGALAKTRLPKLRRRIGGFHTLEQVEKIIAATETPRERALIELLFATGCRVSEIAGMLVEHIVWETRTVKVLGKGNVERIVCFGAPAEKALRKYLADRTAGSLFNARSRHLERWVHEVGIRAGIKTTPHYFRHSYATAMLNGGVGLREVQELLGHKHVTTTARYLHSSIADLAKVHRQFHPHEDGKVPEPNRKAPPLEPPVPRAEPKPDLEHVLDYWRDKLGNAFDFVAKGDPKAGAGEILKLFKKWNNLPLEFRQDVAAVLRHNGASPAPPASAVTFLEFWQRMTPELRDRGRKDEHGRR